MNGLGHHVLHRLENPVRPYAWGSASAIPEHLGIRPTGEPQAELWLGAHPCDPSILVEAGVRLDDFLAHHPEQLDADPARFDGQLPFLMKLLAAARPLSLQVHPNLAQARAGFAREDAAGLPPDHPERNYKDPQHKPEIIVALSPFSSLCGFRPPADTRADLADLLGQENLTGVAAELDEALGRPGEPDALRAAFELVLSGRPEIRALVRRLVDAAQEAVSPLADTIRFLGASYGDDPGVLGAAMLNRVDLMPGEALYLDAGNIHAYLSGLGIEAMAPSDNVLRGGLTPKRVDVQGLLEIVNFRSIVPTRVDGRASEAAGVRLVSYRPPVREFSVHIIEADGGPRSLPELAGPALLIVARGTLEVSSGGEVVALRRGESLYHAGGSPVTVRSVDGPATAYATTVGESSLPA